MSEYWFRIGHTTHEADRTGCTAIVFDELVPAVVDVRGGAPGTRETTLLEPGRRGVVDGIMLSGGSAFGLRTADGLMDWLAERGRGVQTPVGRVPLVPAAIIYDLASGSDRIPTPADGYAAADAATYRDWQTGRVGAGTGATVAKLEGERADGGIGISTVPALDAAVTAVVVVNAVGTIVDPNNGKVVTGRSSTGSTILQRLTSQEIPEPPANQNTTIGAIMISVPLSRDALIRCAVAAHNGLARCIVPSHTVLDGDTLFCCAPATTAEDDIRLTLALSAACQFAVEQAILDLFAAPNSA